MVRALYWIALLSIIALALALRLPNLAQRPMHNDEGVNAVKFNDLRIGKFEYDPNEYHGPTLYYFTLPVAWLTGAKDFASTDEVTLRLVAVIFGIGLILLLPLVSDGLGRGGVLWAGLFTAVSPAFVFYSRYYIHEMPLVFFAFGAIACGWRYRRSNHLAWAAVCGVFVGLTFATKETWVLALAAAAASAVTAATIWRLLIKGIPHHLHFRKRAVAIGFVAFLVVFVLLFSQFFTRMAGPVDAVMAYVHYSGRASGGVHDHPWNYYLKLLIWSPMRANPDRAWWNRGWTEGAIIALAILGFLMAVLRRHHAHASVHSQVNLHESNTGILPVRNDLSDEVEFQKPADHAKHGQDGRVTNELSSFPAFPPFVRFVGFYTLFLVVAFSIIPYKTPWCLLGFLHGMILMAGFACGQIIHLAPGIAGKTIAALTLITTAAHLAWESDRATNNFADAKHPNYFVSNPYNPYAYSPTRMDIFNLVKRMDEIASVSTSAKDISIDVITPDCWPLPFYLRHFTNVGYPLDPARYRKADVIIGVEEDSARLTDENAKTKYVARQFGLRPSVMLWVYVRQELWDKLQAKWRK